MSEKEPKPMYGGERLRFSTSEELRAYYEAKYRAGGYGNGVTLKGVNISNCYHDARRSAVLELLRPQAGERILDAGCGDGVFSAFLAGAGCEVDAVDIASNALAPELVGRDRLRFQQMDLEALKFPSRSFDKVVCVEVLEHCLYPESVIREIARVLKPGGQLVLTYPTINETMVRRWRLAPRLKIAEHLTEWSYEELQWRLTADMLTVERSLGVAFDFGFLLLLKRLSATFARGVTKLQLGIRCFPRNSMFVVISARNSPW